MILATFSYAAQSGSNPLQNITSNDNWVSLDVTFTANLDSADVITLTNLVNRMADYFIFTTDGVTSLGNPGVISTSAGSAITIILVYLQGDGTVRTGMADAVNINVIPVPISTTTGNMNTSNGQFSFTFGTQTMLGTVSSVVSVGLLQPMTLNVSWT